VVVLVEIVVAVCFEEKGVGGPESVGFVTVGTDWGSGGGVFGDEAFVAVDEPGEGIVSFFPEAAAEGVVAVLGDDGAGWVFYAAQAAFWIVKEPSGLTDGCSGDHAAVGIVSIGDGAGFLQFVVVVVFPEAVGGCRG